MEIIKGKAAIDKAIASIANRGKKLDESIQQAGLSVILHVEEHGDTTVADSLLNAMAKGSRKLALVEWMLAFGKLRVLDKTNPADALRIADGATLGFDREKSTDMQGAAETMWHEFRKEQDVAKAFDVQAAVQGMLKRVQAAMQKGAIAEADREKAAALVDMLAKM